VLLVLGKVGWGRLDYIGGMDSLALSTILAHAGHGHGPGGAELAAIALAAMIIPLIVLVFIGRAFWRAAKRDSEEPPVSR
jgi:hypothetical protein